MYCYCLPYNFIYNVQHNVTCIQCSKCRRTFLPAGVEEITATMSERLTSNEEDMKGGVKEENERLCVFCRLKDPSRTLEQRSGQYLSDYKVIS